jgi:glycosyltransferase involved in cell wall biosynthesis
MGCCIVIPAYNAESTLGAVLAEVLQQGLPVLVVDDGSTDATAAVAASFQVTLLRHETNRGKGAALKTGFAWALDQGFSGVVTLDADGQHDPTAIPCLVEVGERQQYGILLASRYEQFQQMAGLRKHWNRFGAWCMRKRTGFKIDDSQSGFRVYSSRLLRSVNLTSAGYDLEMEILIKCWKAGFSIGSVPVAARVADGRSTSHFRPVRDTWQICMTFLKYSIPCESPNAAKP